MCVHVCVYNVFLCPVSPSVSTSLTEAWEFDGSVQYLSRSVSETSDVVPGISWIHTLSFGVINLPVCVCVSVCVCVCALHSNHQ